MTGKVARTSEKNNQEKNEANAPQIVINDKKSESTLSSDDWTVFKLRTNRGINATKKFLQLPGEEDKKNTSNTKKNDDSNNRFKVLSEDPDLYPTEEEEHPDPNKNMSKTGQQDNAASKEMKSNPFEKVSANKLQNKKAKTSSDRNDKTDGWNNSKTNMEITTTVQDTETENKNKVATEATLMDKDKTASQAHVHASWTVERDGIQHKMTKTNVDAEDYDQIQKQETVCNREDTLTLRVEHVLRNGKVFDDKDHQTVLKAITSVHPVHIQVYHSTTDNDEFFAMNEVAKYALDWRDFASCVSTKHSRTKGKQIIFYKLRNDGTFQLRQLKKNKKVMDLLKGLEVFIFVDHFHRKATRDAGYLVGLHSRLTNWVNLNERLHQAVQKEHGGEKLTFEVYKKHLWVPDTSNNRNSTRIFSIKGKVRQIETLQRTLKTVINKKKILGCHVDFTNAP